MLPDSVFQNFCSIFTKYLQAIFLDLLNQKQTLGQ